VDKELAALKAQLPAADQPREIEGG
jgi:hypothetical protein